MGLIPWWVKALVIAALVASVYGMYSHWRSGIEQVGYDRAVAEYAPRLREWQASHKQWEAAYARLDRQVVVQNTALVEMSAASKAREIAARQRSQEVSRQLSTAREQGLDLARILDGIRIREGECDALFDLVDAARAGGL